MQQQKRDSNDGKLEAPPSKRLKPNSNEDSSAEAMTTCENEWSYENKEILAPMVRISTLPFRKICTDFGADIVYSPEHIAPKAVKYVRSENKTHGTIEFTIPGCSYPAFRTYPGEPVVFQIGTPNSTYAVQAANLVAGDVRAIDVNMGCPKLFSLQGKMGVSLLTDRERVRDILTSLVRNIDLPITCKIRILPDVRDTIDLLKTIESCGVAAIGIHARGITDRPRYKAVPDQIPLCTEHINIPILYNGDVFNRKDINELKEISKASSVLIARGAMWNPSIFRKEGPLPVYDVCQKFLDTAIFYEHNVKNTKYICDYMLKSHQSVSKHKSFSKVSRSQSYQDIQNALIELKDVAALTKVPYQAPIIFWDRRPLPGESHADTKGTGVKGMKKKSTKQKKEAKIIKKQLEEFAERRRRERQLEEEAQSQTNQERKEQGKEANERKEGGE